MAGIGRSLLHAVTDADWIIVELIPGPLTEPRCVEEVRYWLQRLGRTPIALRQEVPGNAAGRIAAAVWRECVQLVLEDVVDVVDVDCLVALGPGLGWAAAGPHLTHHLAARERGAEIFLAELLRTFEEWWAGLAKRNSLSVDEQTSLIRAIERAYGSGTTELRAERDERLARLRGYWPAAFAFLKACSKLK